MNLLTIDTANEYLSLAVCNNQNKITTYQAKVNNKQSEHILPSIHKLLEDSQLSINELSGIGYNTGPGSFTGLRIGLSISLGLAYSLNIPLFPVDMFMLYAKSVPQDYNYTLITLDARLGQIYVAAINISDLNYVIKPCLIYPHELVNLISENNTLSSSNCIVTGSGWDVYGDIIGNELVSNFNYFSIDYPDADKMLAVIHEHEIKPCLPHEAELLYLRNKVALNLEEQKLNSSK